MTTQPPGTTTDKAREPNPPKKKPAMKPKAATKKSQGAVDDASADSFPASDPPAWSGSTAKKGG